MSDASVGEALRSELARVLIEAPAGTGKTFQAASYAQDAARHLRKGQKVLVLARTHAACGVISERTAALRGSVQVGTIDSLVSTVAKVYHRSLNLPSDIHGWSIGQGSDCYDELARRVNVLLSRSAGIVGALVERYPVVICDEHQDSTADQQGIVDTLSAAGARVRFFGDPMQAIFHSGRAWHAQQERWRDLAATAHANEQLNTAHRWANGSPALGAWVLRQRELLRGGESIDLRHDRPHGMHVYRADNVLPGYGSYRISNDARRTLDAWLRPRANFLVLTAHSAIVRALGAFWGWRTPIWEGQTRDATATLLTACHRNVDDPLGLGRALCDFLIDVGGGFSNTAFGNRLQDELNSGCARPSRGKPAAIQSVARLILAQPNHIGIGAALNRVRVLMQDGDSFSDCRVHLRREFAEACRINVHAEVSDVFAEQALRRARGNVALPNQAISTIHKSKGLEVANAIVMPCDAGSFSDRDKNRCLLYVALSRATDSMALVVPETNPSPLVLL